MARRETARRDMARRETARAEISHLHLERTSQELLHLPCRRAVPKDLGELIRRLAALDGKPLGAFGERCILRLQLGVVPLQGCGRRRGTRLEGCEGLHPAAQRIPLGAEALRRGLELGHAPLQHLCEGEEGEHDAAGQGRQASRQCSAKGGRAETWHAPEPCPLETAPCASRRWPSRSSPPTPPPWPPAPPHDPAPPSRAFATRPALPPCALAVQRPSRSQRGSLDQDSPARVPPQRALLLLEATAAAAAAAVARQEAAAEWAWPWESQRSWALADCSRSPRDCWTG